MQEVFFINLRHFSMTYLNVSTLKDFDLLKIRLRIFKHGGIQSDLKTNFSYKLCISIDLNGFSRRFNFSLLNPIFLAFKTGRLSLFNYKSNGILQFEILWTYDFSITKPLGSFPFNQKPFRRTPFQSRDLNFFNQVPFSCVHLFNYETPLIIALFKLRNSLTLAFQLQTPLILVFFFFLLRNSLTLAFQLQNPSDLSFF